jgi:hypothetical protein
MWIVMKHYTVDFDDPAYPSRERNQPLYYFDSVSNSAALALSQKLNRVNTVWHSLATLANDRKGPDHADQLTRAEAVVKRMDPNATPDATYSVEQSQVYAGPTEDLTPVIVAMMTAFAQLPDPPADPFSAIYRLIGA